MLKNENNLLPELSQLDHILNLNWGADVDSVMNQYLLSPLREFLDKPGKKIRGRMVEIGFRLAAGDSVSEKLAMGRNWISRASDLLESLHSASLIIDDIQDNSELRRGQPTVHKKYGMPLALNAGNWLYFWPLQNVSEWDISTETKLRVYRVCHRGLLRAHFGQALDVGLNIFEVSQDKVKTTSLASLELKSGALMAMALSLGAVLGGASSELEEACDRFGHAFGIALQMFDDAGNASIEGPKQFEDLLLRRPSWLVATAAGKLSSEKFIEFKENVEKLPESGPLKTWLRANQLIELARTEAQKYLDESMNLLEHSLFEKCVAERKEISELAQLLVRAYV